MAGELLRPRTDYGRPLGATSWHRLLRWMAPGYYLTLCGRLLDAVECDALIADVRPGELCRECDR